MPRKSNQARSPRVVRAEVDALVAMYDKAGKPDAVLHLSHVQLSALRNSVVTAAARRDLLDELKYRGHPVKVTG